jgi:hypothetical protein
MKRTSSTIAALAIAAAVLVIPASPASAGAAIGPYASNAQCNADRTEYVRSGGRANACGKGVGGWYYATY